MILKNNLFIKNIQRGTLAFCAVAVPFFAIADQAIRSVTGSVQGGAEVLRVELAEPLSALPTGFSTQSPARIALDFPGATNGSGRSVVEINQGNLRSANVVEAGGRSRIVLNLKQPTSYKAELQGNSLLIMLDAVSSSSLNQVQTPVKFSDSYNNNTLAIKDIDFRRGADGSGRVIVELPNNQIGVDLQQQGKGLAVEFLRSSLPEEIGRAHV